MHDVLRVGVSHVDGMVRVTVHGEVDANSALALRAPLDQLDSERRICVDVAGVHFMDSTGINVLLTQRMRMLESGGSIHICNPSADARRIVEITGLCEVFFEADRCPRQPAVETL